MTSPEMVSLCPPSFPLLFPPLPARRSEHSRTAPLLQPMLWFTYYMESKTIWKTRKGHLSQSLLRCEHLTLRLQFSQAFLHMLLSSLSTRTEMDSCVSQNNPLSLSSGLCLAWPCIQNMQTFSMALHTKHSKEKKKKIILLCLFLCSEEPPVPAFPLETAIWWRKLLSSWDRAVNALCIKPGKGKLVLCSLIGCFSLSGWERMIVFS